ncbi:MAG: polysaccharide biosynthesis/export family protein [Deltaproteobacteria bacterium]|nr:polysaccharide biosynthesis/export family protein [Deltaproteobacteria bacterium]
MKTVTILLSSAFFLAMSLPACVTPTGEVVKVRTVKESPFAVLKEKDRAQLEEIKKTTKSGTAEHGLSSIIEETPHYTVTQYFKEHPELRGPGGRDYRVGGYDVLSITVYEEKDLSREAVRVSADGYISFPFVGRLKVNGLNTSEIEKMISGELAKGQFLLDAHVSVLVTEYNSKRFLVLGSVKNPGSYSLRAEERVLDAISKAEGIDSEQAGRKGMIIRTEEPNTPNERKIVINLDIQGLLKGQDQVSNIFLVDKDVVYIPTAEHFYIIGQVQQPGSFQLIDRDITLVEAISKAGGFTPIAARNKTRIIRVEDGVQKMIEVKVDAITDAGKKIQDVVIQPNDVIVVPESFF